jgi:hypothetical protein
MQSSTANVEYAVEAETAVVQRMREITTQDVSGALPPDFELTPQMVTALRLLAGQSYLIELITGIDPAQQFGADPFQLLAHAAHELVGQQVRYDHLASILAELHVKTVGNDGPVQYLENGSLDFEFWAFMRENNGQHVDPSEIANEILGAVGRSESAAA